MKLCYNGKLLKKTLPEKISKLFEKTKVLKIDSERECFILDSNFKDEAIEAAIRFYEAPKPFSNDDLALFIKYKKELYKISKSLKLPSLQNFSHAQLKPQSFKHVSTEIEDDIIIFGEQDINNYYQYKKSHFPSFPMFRFGFKTKVNLSGEDKFIELYKNYENLQLQIDSLDEELQNHKSKQKNIEKLDLSCQSSNDPSDKIIINSNHTKIAKRASKKLISKQDSDELEKLSTNDNKNSIINDATKYSENDDGTINTFDKLVLSSYKNLKFKGSRANGVSCAYSSSFNDECSNVDLLSNTDGWFYQSEDKEGQFVMFKFASPIIIDYYFIMTYSLPKGFSHLKKWRLATLKKNDDNSYKIFNIDERETLELDGVNKMCGFQVNYSQPVDNVFIQMTGNNVLNNSRLTLQNVFLSTNPPLDYDSPFYGH